LTNPIRVVNIEPLPDWIQGIYESVFDAPDYDLVWAAELSDAELEKALPDAEILVTGKRPITEQMINRASEKLRLIQTIGRAPWAVDLAVAQKAGVPVSQIPHGGAIAVAEHTLALMLGVYRKLVTGHLGTVGSDYIDLDLEPIRTSERVIAFNWLKMSGVEQLFGKTLGLIGFGDIGLEVARRARAFDMEVLYTKRHRMPPEHEEMAGVTYGPLDELLNRSDVVSLNAPHTDETEGMIGAAEFSLMKETAILVNTARGGLVDEDALVDALADNRLAGAGLDVFIDEPAPVGHPLLELENVLLSPHTGGGTGGGQKGVVNELKANIERLVKGEPPLYLASS